MPAADTVKRRRRPGPLPFPVFDPSHVMTGEEASLVVSFGVALRDMRDVAGMDRVGFAARLEAISGVMVPVGVVTSWEAGRQLPPPRLACKFGKVLGFDDHEYLIRAAEVHETRTKLLATTEKARIETAKALEEDGRPPRARRRSSKKRS